MKLVRSLDRAERVLANSGKARTSGPVQPHAGAIALSNKPAWSGRQISSMPSLIQHLAAPVLCRCVSEANELP